MLADWAAIAIENARLYRDLAARRDELEQAVRGLEATTAIARAVGARDRARPRPGADRQARAGAGRRARDGDPAARGRRAGGRRRRRRGRAGRVGAACRWTGSTAGEVLRRGPQPERIADVASALRHPAEQLGVPDAADRAARAARVPRPSARRAGAFDRIGGELEFGDRGRAAAAGVRRQRGDGGRDRAVGRGRAAARVDGRRRGRSAGAGRASCTTRRCRGSAACACCSTAALRAATRGMRSSRRARTAVEQIDARDREAAHADHRAAPGGARRARPAAGDRGARAAASRAVEGIEVEAEVERRRTTRLDARARDRGLPDRPGGAHQRRQARAREPRRDRACAAPTARSTSRSRDDGGGFDPARRARASA